MTDHEIHFRSDMKVTLIDAMGDDLMIARAAWEDWTRVPKNDKHLPALIGTMLRDRHGCYDDETEVLTANGWKPWPKVHMMDQLCTLRDGEIYFELPMRVVHEDYDGDMVRIKAQCLDLLLTPNHRVYVDRKYDNHWTNAPNFEEAADLGQFSSRFYGVLGEWDGPDVPLDTAEFIGFFIGDGCLASPGTASFHLHKERKVQYLQDLCVRAGLELRAKGDRYTVTLLPPLASVLADCYNDERDKCIPYYILDAASSSLRSFLAGLIEADGYRAPSGCVSITTVSKELAGQLQEVGLKIGTRVTIREMKPSRGAFGTRLKYVVRVGRGRNDNPEIGRTWKDRARQVTTEPYKGKVHCATVLSGLLYVRRGGMPVWCGNSIFEFGSLVLHIECPLFVVAQFQRHRIGFSYAQRSARYREMLPHFYEPDWARPLVNVGTKMKPSLDLVQSREQQTAVMYCANGGASDAWDRYQNLLEQGIAEEVARIVLPVSTYTGFSVQMNPRSIMNFLQLRVADERNTYDTRPQYEIEQVAKQIEAFFAARWPITYQKFNEHGRVAP
jgi:thymidylate synthase (FAD)